MVFAIAAAACGPRIVDQRERVVEGQLGPQTDAPPFDSRVAGPATRLTDRLGRPIDPNGVRVALLLPLSGDAAALGQDMLNAAEMALFDIGIQNYQLIPRDTRGTPQGAAAAARDALESGAQLVLGPLFSTSVGPVAGEARRYDVNVVAFTTDADVAGDNALVMGFLPEQQVERVVSYAVSRGHTRVAVLAPGTDYGRLVADLTTRATAQYGAQTADVLYYDANGREFSADVQTLAERSSGIDAVMLPDGGFRLRAVAPLLPYFGLRDTQLLGTGQWDGQPIGVETALQGAWFAAPDPRLRSAFEERFEENFGAPPRRLATLAYDAVALSAVLSQVPDGTGFSTRSLTDPSGFVGLDGIFRFGPDGLVDRGLAVLRVTEEGASVVDAAPTTFATAVF